MESRLLTVGLARLAGEPRVWWNNYNPVIEAYQGELIDKDRYKRAFLGSARKNLQLRLRKDHFGSRYDYQEPRAAR
jgi:hypothetical protein